LFKQNAQKVGLVQTEKGEHIVVRDYVYSTLWKHVKFVTNENELDFDGLIAKTVMREVNVANDDTIQQEFWNRNRCKVLKWVNQKRNNTIGAVKKEFISKFITRCGGKKRWITNSNVGDGVLFGQNGQLKSMRGLARNQESRKLRTVEKVTMISLNSWLTFFRAGVGSVQF
jgi:hypothetical protein